MKNNPPPFNILMTENTNTNCMLLKTIIKKYCQFAPTIHKSGKDLLSVRTSYEKDYRAFQKHLDNHTFEHFLYKTNETTPIKVVTEHDLDEIKNDLQKQNFDIIKISQLSSFKNKSLLPLILITLKNIDQAKNIVYQITKLGYLSVKVEDYRKLNTPRQCFKCQRYHHVSNLCFFAPRCVKCSEEHLTKDCPTKKIPWC